MLTKRTSLVQSDGSLDLSNCPLNRHVYASAMKRFVIIERTQMEVCICNFS